MTPTLPNLRLRAWRNARNWTRAEMAAAVTAQAGRIGEAGLFCTESRVEKWERGDALWPRAPFRKALRALTGVSLEELGFIPPDRHTEHHAAANRASRPSVFLQETYLADTLELASLTTASSLGANTIDGLHEATNLLCRAYPTVNAEQLRERTHLRLHQVLTLIGNRTTLREHRELLVAAGWLWALLGCLYFDLGRRELAETARRSAFDIAQDTGDAELAGWSFELSAWFALVEERYEAAIQAARAGQNATATSSAHVQLTLQEARGLAKIGDRRGADDALTRGAAVLSTLPLPEHPEHHFIFDHNKWLLYASTCYTALNDTDRAEEHAIELIQQHTRADGSTNAPMRIADAQIDLGLIHVQRGNLDGAVELGSKAFNFDRFSAGDLIARAGELDQAIQEKFPGEEPAHEFHERYIQMKRQLTTVNL